MRRLRLIMVPITISWFAGVLWWISHRDGCGCGTSIETNTQRVVADPNIPASPTMANEAAMEAAIDPGIATDAIDPVLLQPIVIPFVKNQQGAGASAEVAQYAEALKAALLVDPSSSILVAGHTDADGDAELNKRLSKERAEVIKARLVGCGISEDRIRATVSVNN